MVRLFMPNWTETKVVLTKGTTRLASELELGLAMCDVYKFSQKEMLITFEKAARRDITISTRK